MVTKDNWGPLGIAADWLLANVWREEVVAKQDEL